MHKLKLDNDLIEWNKPCQTSPPKRGMIQVIMLWPHPLDLRIQEAPKHEIHHRCEWNKNEDTNLYRKTFPRPSKMLGPFFICLCVCTFNPFLLLECHCLVAVLPRLRGIHCIGKKTCHHSIQNVLLSYTYMYIYAQLKLLSQIHTHKNTFIYTHKYTYKNILVYTSMIRWTCYTRISVLQCLCLAFAIEISGHYYNNHDPTDIL